MSGDAFTMCNVRTLYLLLQLLGIHLAGRHHGSPESLNELPAGYPATSARRPWETKPRQ
jgi:hypothetical protein